MGKLKIRRLTNYSEFERCMEIQRKVWRHKDIDITPVHQYCISVKIGAILLGAFLEDEMVGFVYSFPEVINQKIGQHSHLLAVLPPYRGKKIGKELKWAQRRHALRLGYDRITWTFDPLQARNAKLNLHTLGATVKSYLSNFYGAIPSLTPRADVPTDRFFTEWWIQEERVAKRRKGKHENYHLNEIPLALQRRAGPDKNLIPQAVRLSLEERQILVEVPPDISQMSQDPEGILRWQRAIRRVMKHYFSLGYRAVDFLYSERCFYILERQNEMESS